MELKKSMGLGTKITLLSVGVVAAVVAANYWAFLAEYRKDMMAAYTSRAGSFATLAEESQHHTSNLHASKVFSTQALIDEAQQAMQNGQPFSKTKYYHTHPIIAGYEVGHAAALREKIDFKLVSFDSRDPSHEIDKNSFRGKLLADLETQVKSGGETTLARVDDDANMFHYMRAVKIDESCLSCHGDPATNDARDEKGAYDGKDPFGFAMEGHKTGDMYGAYEVQISKSYVDQNVAEFIKHGLMFTIPMVIGAVVGLIFLMRSMLSRPLNKLIDVVKDIATGDGDLTKRISINRGDEIGALAGWFDSFLDNLQKLIGQVSGATREVASAATEIAASAEEMAVGLRKQGEQTGQVSAAVEEMASSVTEVAKKSIDASQAASASQSDASQGGQVVEQTVSEIKAIADDVNRSAQAVTSLGRKSEQIGQIINVINDIADQTNLLALNAAIEAARAGEHGRGFAVVADEVRKLAERTTKATEEVGQSIREIQDETVQAVTLIEAGSKRVVKGVDLANTAGNALGRITQSSEGLAGMVQSIAAAAEEQSAASEQISRSITSINEVTRESTEGADQAAKAAAMLSRQAETLQSLVGRFKV